MSIQRANVQKKGSKKLLFNQLETPLEENLRNSSIHQLNLKVVQSVEDSKTQSQNFDSIVTQDENQKMSVIVSTLISKNKINSKNAFEVPLVDVSDLRYFESQDQTSWSKISFSLENSSKIYGFRVDSVSESISKMTSSLNRSSLVENVKQVREMTDKNEPEASRLTKQYNEMDINRHLDEIRLNQDFFYPEKRIIETSDRLRRMMDQNGMSGLIMGTIPIGPDLQIDIQNNGWQIKVNIFKQIDFQQPKLSFPIHNETLNVTKQISKVIHAFNNTCESMAEEDYQCFLRQNSQIQLTVEVQPANFHLQEACLTDNIGQGLSFNGFPMKFSKEMPLHQKANHKGVKGESKKPKRSTKALNPELQEPNLDFSGTNVLLKQQVMKVRKPKDDIPMARASKSQKNLLTNVFTSFSLQNARNLNQFQSNQFQNVEQIQKEGIETLTEIVEEIRNSISKSAEEDSFKCPRIRQNKEEIIQILDRVERSIKFSELYHRHKQCSQPSSEAIDFLSVLHLANELGLILTEMSCYDFTITK